MAAAVLLPGMMEMTAGTCLEAFAQEVERIGPGGQTANVQEVKTQTAGNQVNPVPSNQIPANAPTSQVGGVNQAQNPVSMNNSGELKGVWISYLEWEKLPKGEAEFKQAVDGMMDLCELGLKCDFPSCPFPYGRHVSFPDPSLVKVCFGSAGSQPGV